MRTGMVSPHFSWEEFRCADGTDVPDDLVPNALILADACEAVRGLYDRPVTGSSFYRTPAHNALVGGKQGSYHLVCLAADLLPPAGVTVFDFWEAICDLAPRTAIRGIGYAPESKGNFVHIDCRASNIVRHWHY